MRNLKRVIIIMFAMALLINPMNAEAKTKSKTTIKKIKVTKDSLTIKLKVKKSKKIKGYQLRCSTKKNMKNAVKVTVKKKNLKILRLEANKTYYVQVRDIKVVKGKKVYSKWSPKKQVKTKSSVKKVNLHINYEDGISKDVSIDSGCNHNWVEKYENRENCYWKEVLVREGYVVQNPIYEWRDVHICSTCGADITNESQSQHVIKHMLEDPENAKGYYTKPTEFVIGYEEEYVKPKYEKVWTVETEEVLVGYECSKCHCTKQ